MTTFLYALKYPFIHDETAAAGSANASILIGFWQTAEWSILTLTGLADINTTAAERLLSMSEKIIE